MASKREKTLEEKEREMMLEEIGLSDKEIKESAEFETALTIMMREAGIDKIKVGDYYIGIEDEYELDIEKMKEDGIYDQYASHRLQDETLEYVPDK